MASELKVNKISPESGTTLTLGDSGDTINFGSGVLPNFENLTVTGDLTVDTNSLKVDSTNNRVGIGTATPSVALDVVGGASFTDNVDLGDSDRLRFGASQDLQIYHDGSHSYISDQGTGNLILQASNSFKVENSGGTETYIFATENGAVELKYDNSTKIATTSTGITVTGTVAATSYTGDGSSLTGITSTTINNNADNRVITGSGTANTLEAESNLVYDGTNLGIGTSSPNSPQAVNLHISGTSSAIRMSDTTNSLTGNLYASGGEFSVLTSSSHPIIFKTANSERMRIKSNGNVSIGTTNDYGILTIGQGTVTSNVGQFNLYDTTSGGGANTGGSIAFMGSDGVSDRGYAVIRGLKQNSTAGNYSGYLSFLTRNNGASVAEGMRIHPEGYTELKSGDAYNQLVLTPSGTNAPATINFNTPGSGRARFRVQGNEYMTILSNGNVGIGTSSPTRLLSLEDTGGTYMDYDDSAGHWTTGVDTNGFIIYDTTNSVYRIKIDNTNGHVLPGTNNAQDLGSSSAVWRNIYTSDFHMSNEGLDKGNDIDGTKGSWTFQEGENDLFLINNKNGKKYKFNLTEVA